MNKWKINLLLPLKTLKQNHISYIIYVSGNSNGTLDSKLRKYAYV